jgi:hypothetical protein
MFGQTSETRKPYVKEVAGIHEMRVHVLFSTQDLFKYRRFLKQLPVTLLLFQLNALVFIKCTRYYNLYFQSLYS